MTERDLVLKTKKKQVFGNFLFFPFLFFFIFAMVKAYIYTFLHLDFMKLFLERDCRRSGKSGQKRKVEGKRIFKCKKKINKYVNKVVIWIIKLKQFPLWLLVVETLKGKHFFLLFGGRPLGRRGGSCCIGTGEGRVHLVKYHQLNEINYLIQMEVIRCHWRCRGAIALKMEV